MTRPVVMALALLALCAGLYSWTADFPMAFDDHTYLRDNPVFARPGSFGYLSNFTEFANLPAKLGSDPDYAVNFILRPVSYATFYWNYLFDGYAPRWFRVTNMVIHWLNALLIYGLVLTVLRRSVEENKLGSSSRVFIASAAAFLFAAHPLATESVTYIIQRFTSMVLLFSLLSLWLYFLSLSVVGRSRVWLLRGGAVVSLLVAMQTKENAFMVPFLAVMIDWLVRGSGFKKACVSAVPLLLCAPLIPLLVVLTAAAHSGGLDLDASLNIVNSRDEPLSHWHYLVTQITVVAHYLRLLIWPTGLNLDPEWPKYESLWEGPVLLSISSLLVLLTALGWLFWKRRDDVRFRAAFVFTLWFFITVSVSSGLVPLPDMMAEHRSYMPSVGIFILAACLLDRLRMAALWRGLSARVMPVFVVLAVGALSWATCARNEVWRTNESLWKDTVAKSPGKYRTWGNLGTAYSRTGREEKAVDCYRKALEIEPRFQNGLLNLSNSLLRLNRPKESLNTTLKLIKVDESAANKVPVAFTLGLGFAGVGRYDEAVSIFRQILASVPDDPMAHKALGIVYQQTGLPHRAIDHYRQALRLLPGDEELRTMVASAQAEISRNTGRPLQ
ncbi:MAG: tetratricopeptide repeat protein [Prosthecobacter sp.]